ncbi:MAG: hypothetical protein EZS28_043315, partial [Streblomastix strix]
IDGSTDVTSAIDGVMN